MVWHKGTIRRAVSECGVLLIIGFFAYTLVNKLLQFDAFKLNLARTGIFEARMVDLVAYFAVTMEAAPSPHPPGRSGNTFRPVFTGETRGVP